MLTAANVEKYFAQKKKSWHFKDYQTLICHLNIFLTKMLLKYLQKYLNVNDNVLKFKNPLAEAENKQ